MNQVPHDKIESLTKNSPELLSRLQVQLLATEEVAIRVARVLGGNLLDTILADLLIGNVHRWTVLASEATALITSLNLFADSNVKNLS